MDQGVINLFKHIYRSIVLEKLVIAFEDLKEGYTFKSVDEFYKVTVYNALNIVRSSWSQVTETTIKNCFRHAGFVTSTGGGEEENLSDACTTTAAMASLSKLRYEFTHI